MNFLDLNEKMRSYCSHLQRVIPSFLFAGIIDSKTGLVVAKSDVRSILSRDLEAASMHYARIHNHARELLSEGFEIKLQFNDVVIESDKITFLISFSEHERIFTIIALETTRANISVARSFLDKARQDFAPILNELFS